MENKKRNIQMSSSPSQILFTIVHTHMPFAQRQQQQFTDDRIKFDIYVFFFPNDDNVDKFFTHSNGLFFLGFFWTISFWNNAHTHTQAHTTAMTDK